MKVTKEMKPLMPWVIVGPAGVRWLGHASCEADAWEIALGWPSAGEISEHKKKGFYAAEATVSWKQGEHKREWVGLTDEEAAACWSTSAVQTWKNFEAKLKEKNT